MTTTIVLSVTSPTQGQTVVGDAVSVAVSAGSTVTLSAKVSDDAGGTQPSSAGIQLFHNTETTGVAPTTSGTTEWTVTAGDSPNTFGRYQAKLADDSSNIVEILDASKKKAIGAGATGDETPDATAPLELAIGEYDKWFTYITLAVFLAVTALVLWIGWEVLTQITLPDQSQTDIGDGIYVDGRWSERLEGILLVIGATSGAVLLVLGTWLGALETRGRLRAQPATAGTRSTLIPLPSLADFTKLISAASQARATTVVLAFGFGLLGLVTIVGVTTIGQDGAITPSPTTTTTVTVTPEPAPVTPSPSVSAD